jgi:hypothetical protein
MRSVRTRLWASLVRYGSVWAAGVVLDRELREQGLWLVDRCGLIGLGSQPLLHGRLEAFDLALCGGVVGWLGLGVLLGDASCVVRLPAWCVLRCGRLDARCRPWALSVSVEAGSPCSLLVWVRV